MPAPNHKSHQQRGARGRFFFGGSALGGGQLPRLAQGQFDAINKLVHASLQALVFVDQCITDHHLGHTGVLLGKIEQHACHRERLTTTVFFALGDLVDQRENRGLDKFDQSLIHLRLTGEVAVERGFRHIQFGRERSRGHLLCFRAFQHARKRLQDL